MAIYILNSMIIPLDFSSSDSYLVRVKRVSIEEAKALLKEGFVSAVGHEATAALMTELLGVTIPVNRVAVRMRHGDRGLHFVLLARLPEGAVITSKDELEKLPFLLVLSEVVNVEAGFR